MKNINEVRTQLTEVFEAVKSKRMEPKIAKELNNTSGKIIATLKLQLDYANDRKVKANIPFLNV